MNPRIFVIGDVHGCALTLQHLIFKVIQIRRSDRLYFLGDLIDRGPRSKEVIDTLMRLKATGQYIRSVRGNHEEMLLDVVCSKKDSLILWMQNGGVATLKSFRVESASDIPDEYIKFLAASPHYILLDKFVLCHAGINCMAPDPFEDRLSMLWSRELPVISERIGNRRIICGHTVHSLEEISASMNSDRIFLDAGCVFKDRGVLGNLAALEIGTMTIHHTRNIDTP